MLKIIERDECNILKCCTFILVNSTCRQLKHVLLTQGPRGRETVTQSIDPTSQPNVGLLCAPVPPSKN